MSTNRNPLWKLSKAEMVISDNKLVKLLFISNSLLIRMSFFAKKALVGEVQSFEHLHNFPSTFKADGVSRMKIYYLGGLVVMLNCASSKRAKEFL